ncbi:MAG: sigma 54-interacting transcriptional regulator [Sporomusaceae bacterium]|nr:sigma 54-interacting transcriptional regulator [Sporomusaceae bacterium]
MSRIVAISPFRDLGLAIESIAADMGITVEVYEGWMEHACSIIDGLGEPEVDVFISRGGTAGVIARHCDVPVIRADSGLYDIMECLDEARRISPRIAITLFERPLTGLPLLERTMNIKITEIVFSDLNYVDKRLESLAAEGQYCVVGGGPSIQLANRYGLPSVFLRTGENTIRDSLHRAEAAANLRREEKRRAHRLKAILDSAYDGIIAVDSCENIEIINAAAEHMLRVSADSLIGKRASEVIPNSRLTQVLRTGHREIGQLQDIGSTRIVTNRVPVKVGTEVLGAVATFQDVSRVVKVEQRLRRELTKSHFKARYHLEDIIGTATALAETKLMAKNFASSDLTVLIYGPSGSGKEMFAQGIHNAGARRQHPFVAINCAALPPTLLESELFGYDEGAFTGAKRKGKLGLFELGHEGTVFLDEIEALPVELQGRLLRVLQEKEVLRVGGETIIPVNIRVVAATNRDPNELVETKKMREDLYYRLNVLYLEIPSLRDRPGDIPLLCNHFLSATGFDQAASLIEQMTPLLIRYTWPGNVRELQNFCQRLLFYKDIYLHDRDTEKLIRKIAPNVLAGAGPDDLNSRVGVYETELIRKAVAETGSIRKAAEKLGVGKSTVARKLKKK